MLFIGVDLHKQTITLCGVNRERKVLQRQRLLCADERGIADTFEELAARHGGLEVVVEATASYEWFLQLVERFAQRVVLAHPRKLRVIAESTRKSDKLDAQVLAEFLALDMIPQAHRPTPRQREHRSLVRHRQRIQKQITMLKNTIRRILSHINADIPTLFGSGRGHLHAARLSESDRFAVDQMSAQLGFLETQLRAANQRLGEFAKAGQALETENRALLESIPGVGTVTVDVVISELGDMRRFSSAKKVVAYAGLAPGQRESAGKRKDLHIEKCGSRLLRAMLVEAAWRLVRYSPHWDGVYQRLSRRTGQKKKAIVAIARRLLTVMYALLKSRQRFHTSQPQPPALRRRPRRVAECVT